MRTDSRWNAARLRELRDRSGLTQTELADRVGVSRDTVAKWEAGKKEPGYTNLMVLCEALDVDCTAFTQAPTSEEKRKVGRPKKPVG